MTKFQTEVSYLVEERPDGFWTSFIDADGKPRQVWNGPYPTREKADAEVKASLEAVFADLVKVTLGFK
ncbi:MAG: hypothetical protein DI537_14545 [Stutzerimonas stutzeri]|nr:MAG: hypothetical protein DI537_14545 [Stutzerimonas stutzeri]